MKFTLRIPGLAFDPPPKPSPQDEMFKAVNLYRQQNGLPALGRNPTLDRVAERRANLAIDYYSATGVLTHDDPARTGDRYFEILPTEGIASWLWAGENLALNSYPDPTPEAMRGLINSPTHRDNLLGTWDTLGIGYAWRSPNGLHCFAQIFLDE